MKIKSIVASIGILTLMTGCVSQPKYTEKEQKLKAPKKAISNYEKEFSKLNIMLKKIYHNEKTTMQVATVNNATTGNLQSDIKHFLEKPLIRYLHNYSLIDYDPTYESYRQALGASAQHHWGDYVIVGEISQYDKSVYSEGSGVDVDGEFGAGEGYTTVSAGASEGFSKSLITVDLKIKDANGVFDKVASNTIELFQKNKTANIGIYLNAVGLGVSKNANMKQSMDQALRLVSEYSLIQLIGRFELLPYWRCFTPNLERDEDVVDSWINEFNMNAQVGTSIVKIEQVLKARYQAPYTKVDNNLDNNEIRSLIAIKKYFKIKEDVFNTAKFYVALHENVPYFQKLDLFQSISYEQIRYQPQSKVKKVAKKPKKKKIKRINNTSNTRKLIIISPSLQNTQHVVHHVEEDDDFFRTNNSPRIYRNIGDNTINIGNGN